MEIDKRVATEIAASAGVPLSKLGLRFDKVAVRLIERIRSAIEQEVPHGAMVIMTISVPLKQPAKTSQEIINKLNAVSFVNGKKSHLIFTAFENDIQLSVRPASAFKGMKFVGLVHNADIDANFLLKITEKWLT